MPANDFAPSVTVNPETFRLTEGLKAIVIWPIKILKYDCRIYEVVERASQASAWRLVRADIVQLVSLTLLYPPKYSAEPLRFTLALKLAIGSTVHLGYNEVAFQTEALVIRRFS